MSAFDFITDTAKSVVTSAMQRPVLFKATTDDDSPTPGYLYEEISKLTWEDHEKCADVVSFLVKRLDKDSAAVKLKVLRVMKYCITKGHESFHRDLQRHVEGIKSATQYRPPLHPILGDGPAKQVRDAASELIQIVFENPAAIKRERPKTLGDAQQFNSSGSGSGIGSSSSSSSGGGGGGYSAPQYSSSTATNAAANAYRSSSNQNQYNDDGSKRMWGIGNPNYQAPQSSIIDRVKDGVMDAVTNLAQYGGAPVSSTTYGGGTGKPFTSSSGNYVPPSSAAIQAANSSYNQARFQQTTLSSNSDFQQRKVGEVGGGWGSATAPAIASSTKSSSQKAFGAVAASAAVGAHQEEEEEDDDDDEDEDEEEEEDHDAHHANGNGLSVDRNSPEYRVVTEITQLGVRAHPTREALAEFNQRTRSMNGAVLAAALAQVLAGEEGSHQLRALYVIESAISEGNAKIVNEIKKYGSTISQLSNSSKNSVSTKAIKVCYLLDIEVTAASSQSSTPSTAPLPISSPSVASSTAVAHQLQNMSIWDTPAPVDALSPDSSSSSFDFLGTSAPAAPTPASSLANDSLFDFIGGGSSPAASSFTGSTTSDLSDVFGTSVPHAPTPASSLANDNLLDLLGPAGGAAAVRAPKQPVNLSSLYAAGPGSIAAGPYSTPIPQAAQQQQLQFGVGAPGAYAPSAFGGSASRIAIDPNMIEKTKYSANYIVPSAAPQGTGSKSSFGFVDGKKDSFDFVKDEMRAAGTK